MRAVTGSSGLDVDVSQQQPLEAAVRQTRKRRGLTQTDLAELIGVSLRTITTWEKGDIPLERISDIERALNARFIEGRVGWIVIPYEDAPSLAAADRAIDTTPAVPDGQRSGDGEGRVILYVSQERLDSLPSDIREEASLAAHLEFIQVARRLVRERADENQTPSPPEQIT